MAAKPTIRVYFSMQVDFAHFPGSSGVDLSHAKELARGIKGVYSHQDWVKDDNGDLMPVEREKSVFIPWTSIGLVEYLKG